MNYDGTKSVRIDAEIVEWANSHIKTLKPKPSLASFISHELSKVKDRIEKKKASK